MNFFKQLLHRKQINLLQNELSTKEQLLSSMVEKLQQSESTLEKIKNNLKSSKFPDKEKDDALNYYEEQVRLNKLDVSKYKEEVDNLKEELKSLGVTL